MHSRAIWSRDGVEAEVFHQDYKGKTVKTLVVSLPERRRVLSTFQGFMEVKHVCNHYAPQEVWEEFKDLNECWAYMGKLMDELGLKDYACVCTAVDMDDLAVAEAEHNGVWFTALATAGTSNALRAGFDRTNYYEVNGEFLEAGTINVILVTNASLTGAAMARAIVTATEAKCAVLQDLGVRSSYSPGLLATGTGTDNVVVVSGNGAKITYTGGHSKAGEMIGEAVYKAVKESLEKWLKRKGADNSIGGSITP